MKEIQHKKKQTIDEIIENHKVGSTIILLKKAVNTAIINPSRRNINKMN